MQKTSTVYTTCCTPEERTSGTVLDLVHVLSNVWRRRWPKAVGAWRSVALAAPAAVGKAMSADGQDGFDPFGVLRTH